MSGTPARMPTGPPPVRWLPAVLYTVLLLLLPWGPPQWGDGLEFAAVSTHLGIAHPPGYPLYTLLGWLVQWIPGLGAYTGLLLIGRLSMGACFFFLQEITRRTLEVALDWQESQPDIPAVAAAALFCLGPIALRNVLVVEVYALHVALLSAVLYTIEFPRWQCPAPRFVVACLLLGLAAAHHLTALAFGTFLIPAAIGLVRAPASGTKTLLLGVAAFALPILLLIGTMPLRVPSDAEAHGIYWGEPRSLAPLLEHLQGGEYRQFQFLAMAPGHPFTIDAYIPFALARTQALLRSLGALFLGNGPTAFLAGILAAFLLAIGMGNMLRAMEARLMAIASILALLLTLGFIYTYNIPDMEDYFLAVLLLVVPVAVAGYAGIARLAFRLIRFPPAKAAGATLVILIAVVILGGIVNLVSSLWVDRSLPARWRERLLENLPEGAALLTHVDADIYTMWHLQFVEGERRDVLVYGSNFTRFPWFRMTMNPDDPRRGAVGFRAGSPETLQAYVAELDSLAVRPLVERGRLFTTIGDPAVLGELQKRYRLIPTVNLLTSGEMEYLFARGEVNVAPPVLYELRLPDPPR